MSYFREHLRVGDYLSEQGRIEMIWFGTAAERLGLSGPCELIALERLCAGQHPATGEKLGAREPKAGRRVCYFGQISAPKDVSIALLVGGDRRIEAWWRDAVEETLREIEAVTATRVRRGGLNEDRTTGNMVAAVVTHDTSRALDPQLHTHLCVMNVTYDPIEQRWKGLQPYDYFRNQGYFREVCYNRLAQRMRDGGYILDTHAALGFSIRGFSDQLRLEFSERRRRILETAHARGVTGQDALQKITNETRSAKRHATAADLLSGWETRAGAELAVIRAVIAATKSSHAEPIRVRPNEAMEFAETHIFERRSVVGTLDLLREALIYGRGTVDLRDLRRILGERIQSGALSVSGSEIASRSAIRDEEEFLGWAHAGREACATFGRSSADPALSEEQQLAVTGILASRSRLTILAGDAGTGKTTCLRTLVAGIEQAGGRVFGCAPTSGAADVLRRELTPEADSLQQLLVNEALQRATRDRVLLVDEAGLISVRQMRDLCRLAAANGNRVILVGDVKQHTSVEAGDALRCLQKFSDVPVFRLTQIRRQRSTPYREAVAHLAKGDAFAAFNQFARLGAVKEIPDEKLLLRTAAADYVARARSKESCLAISPVWSEIHAFTDEVRSQLRSSGLVQEGDRTFATVFSLNWTRAQQRDLRNYQPGQVLLFHRASRAYAKGERLTVVGREDRALVVQFEDGGRIWFNPAERIDFDVGIVRDVGVAAGDRLLIRSNSTAARLRNGDLVEVNAVTEKGGIVLSDGRIIPPSFREFSHGYATTSHAAQGKTVDHGILLLGREGISAANLKQAYVSNSRFRLSQTIYTTDRREARAAMMTPADRKLAQEVFPAHRPAVAISPHSPALRIRFGPSL